MKSGKHMLLTNVENFKKNKPLKKEKVKKEKVKRQMKQWTVMHG
jgi:hypothetical protein